MRRGIHCSISCSGGKALLHLPSEGSETRFRSTDSPTNIDGSNRHKLPAAEILILHSVSKSKFIRENVQENPKMSKRNDDGKDEPQPGPSGIRLKSPSKAPRQKPASASKRTPKSTSKSPAKGGTNSSPVLLIDLDDDDDFEVPGLPASSRKRQASRQGDQKTPQPPKSAPKQRSPAKRLKPDEKSDGKPKDARTRLAETKQKLASKLGMPLKAAVFRTPQPPPTTGNIEVVDIDLQDLPPGLQQPIILDSWSSSDPEASTMTNNDTVTSDPDILVGRNIPNPLLERALNTTYVVFKDKLTMLKHRFPGINFDAVAGKQSDDDTCLQNVERQLMVTSLKASHCFFYNEMLEMGPEDAAEAFRNPTILILAPSSDYGVVETGSLQAMKDSLLRPLKAINRDLYRLSNIRSRVPVLSIMLISHRELFFTVTLDAQHQISKLQGPTYFRAWTDEDMEKAEEMIDSLASVVKSINRIAMRAAALEKMPASVKETLLRLGLSLPHKEAPLLLKKFLTFAEKFPGEVPGLMEEVAFPDQETVMQAYEGIISLDQLPRATHAATSAASDVTEVLCLRAKDLVEKSGTIAVQVDSNVAFDPDCPRPCKLKPEIPVKKADLCNVDNEDILMAHLTLKLARSFLDLNKGHLECTNAEADFVVYYDKEAENLGQNWSQMDDYHRIIKEINSTLYCDVVLTPWTPSELYKVAPQSDEPVNGFTTMSLGTLTGKILILQINFPGAGYLPQCEVPHYIEEIVNSATVAKAGFGLISDNRMKAVGLKPINLVDLSNLVPLAFPQKVVPGQVRNSLHYFLQQMGSPYIVAQDRKPMPGKECAPLPSYIHFKMHPDKDNMSGHYHYWEPRLKSFIKVMHHGAAAVVVSLAVKAMEQANLADNANVLPYTLWHTCMVEGQPRYGSISKPSTMNVRPYGSGSVVKPHPDDLNTAAFRMQPPTQFVHSGLIPMRSIDRMAKKFAFDPAGIDRQFARDLEEWLGSLDDLNYANIVKILFKTSNFVLHACQHCNGTDHDTPTEQCLGLIQVCIYPQCQQEGHNIGNCPCLLKRCKECGKLGHNPSHHSKPAHQLQQEFMFACLVHGQAYRYVLDITLAVREKPNLPGKYNIEIAHRLGKDLERLPARPKWLN